MLKVKEKLFLKQFYLYTKNFMNSKNYYLYKMTKILYFIKFLAQLYSDYLTNNGVLGSNGSIQFIIKWS